ncbi:MAG: MurR/RpiR family transcriptional regulator [Clostridiaceae bacterium]
MLILNQLKDKKKFTSVEWEIIEYIENNIKEVLHMTADELAGVTYTSTASIIRLCQKLGLKGYKEFKVRLATEINSFNISGERVREDIPIKKSDTKIEVVKKMLNLSYQALTDTYNDIDVEKLSKVAKMLIEYDNLSIFGKGPSCLIAADFYYKISRIGINAHLDTLPGFSFSRVILKNSSSLAIFVSYYGQQQEYLKLAQMLRKRNIPIILITGPNEGSLCKYATEVIHVSVHEAYVNKIGTFSSRTAMQFVLDSIYSLIFLSNYDENVKLIEAREEIEKFKVEEYE